MSDPSQPTPSSSAESANPYAAPVAEIADAGAVAPALDLTREEVEAFCGKKHLYYWGNWRRATGPNKLMAGFNVAGFFLNAYWLLYRKMYGPFAVGVGAMVLVDVAAGALVPESGEKALDRLIRLAFGITFGLFGNGLYLRRARRIIGAARVQEPDLERRLQLISKKGGVSGLSVVAGIGVSVAIAVLAAR